MATLLQLHFAFNGPFGDAMAEQLKPLAESINQEHGFLWKVWTESEKNHEAGGIYLFTDEKAPLPIWKNILPDLKISALRKLSPKFSMSMSH